MLSLYFWVIFFQSSRVDYFHGTQWRLKIEVSKSYIKNNQQWTCDGAAKPGASNSNSAGHNSHVHHWRASCLRFLSLTIIFFRLCWSFNGRVLASQNRQKTKKVIRKFPPACILAWKSQRVLSETANFDYNFCVLRYCLKIV